MDLARKAVGNYWVIYYLVYVGCVGFYLWRYRNALRGDDHVYLLAAIFGVSVGIALLAAIFLEVIGRMVLLIPAAVKKLKEEGRQEGRKEQRNRINEAYERFGIEVNGVLTLPRTPEVERFLSGESDNRS
jgi:hypothetical protein